MKSDILIIPFTCTVSDEAEAKLARQIPRFIGKRLDASGKIDSRFLSLRENVGSGVVFRNSTVLPTPELLTEIAQTNGFQYVLYGQISAQERIKIDAKLFDVKHQRIIFQKLYDNYATYTFDALEEICYKLLQSLKLETTVKDRVKMFRRETISWEAFLYFLLAEDYRYGLSVGVMPMNLRQPVDAYLEAYRIDSTMIDAENGLLGYTIECYTKQLFDNRKFLYVINELLEINPSSINTLRVYAAMHREFDDTNNVYQALQKALQVAPDSLDIFEIALELYYDIEKYDDIFVLINSVIITPFLESKRALNSQFVPFSVELERAIQLVSACISICEKLFNANNNSSKKVLDELHSLSQELIHRKELDVIENGLLQQAGDDSHACPLD